MTQQAPWRQEIELLQNYPKHKSFTLTTSGATVETVVSLAGNMQECNKVTFVVELGDAWVRFDDDAAKSSSDMFIPQNEGYFDDGIYIADKVTIIRDSSTNVRIRGIMWGR
mgnify:FL=1|jgi:uncharacterized protein (DUF1697 family)|tara:strand:- start:538 stop:870 length:333 start_codon:yes stop_codon:yes gene_type:complete